MWKNLPCSLDLNKHDCTVLVLKDLKCGHKATIHCFDNVETLNCEVSVIKKLSCDHEVKKKCFERIPNDYKCNSLVVKKLSCGHQKQAQCYEPIDFIICSSKCDLTLKCGHTSSQFCKDKPCDPCKLVVDKHCVGSVHVQNIQAPCEVESWKLQEYCKQSCSVVLNCGHSCKSTSCGKCLSGRIHQECKKKCKRDLVCGHECTFTCSKECPPCILPCDNSCVHSKCQNKCSSCCLKCTQICAWRCEHFKCNKLCHEICYSFIIMSYY